MEGEENPSVFCSPSPSSIEEAAVSAVEPKHFVSDHTCIHAGYWAAQKAAQLPHGRTSTCMATRSCATL